MTAKGNLSKYRKRKSDKYLWCVYALRAQKRIRYIGITSCALERRLQQHISESGRITTHKARWIRQSVKAGSRITIRALVRSLDRKEATLIESELIRKYGSRLTNSDNLIVENESVENRKLTVSKYRRRTQDKHERRRQRLAAMRAAKKRKRLANPVEREPKLVRFYPLEFCVRRKLTGETSDWHDIKSVRRVARQIGLLLKYL